MSTVYAAVVFTLNEMLDPVLTLMSVAKPCIDSSPGPLTSHSEGGEPAFEFSHTTGLVGAAHGSAALACADGTAAIPDRTTHNETVKASRDLTATAPPPSDAWNVITGSSPCPRCGNCRCRRGGARKKRGRSSDTPSTNTMS